MGDFYFHAVVENAVKTGQMEFMCNGEPRNVYLKYVDFCVFLYSVGVTPLIFLNNLQKYV